LTYTSGDTKWCVHAEWLLGRRLPEKCSNTRCGLISITTPSKIPTRRSLVCLRWIPRTRMRGGRGRTSNHRVCMLSTNT
jgi:hypothetical protein